MKLKAVRKSLPAVDFDVGDETLKRIIGRSRCVGEMTSLRSGELRGEKEKKNQDAGLQAFPIQSLLGPKQVHQIQENIGLVSNTLIFLNL